MTDTTPEAMRRRADCLESEAVLLRDLYGDLEQAASVAPHVRELLRRADYLRDSADEAEDMSEHDGCRCDGSACGSECRG